MFSQGLAQWAPNRTEDVFPDPWLDYASTVMPEQMADALRWCEFLMNKNGTYRSAIKRVLGYFVTDVEVGDEETGEDEREKYKTFLDETIDIKRTLFDVGMDFMTYGNAFSSLIIPFKRHLRCPRCFTEHPLRIVYRHKEFNFQWLNYEFHATCQAKKHNGEECGYTGPWKRVDRRVLDETLIKTKLWSPHEIDIKHEELTNTRRYIWKIPELYRRKIREGHLHYLEVANWEIIECVKRNLNLEFEEGIIFHLFETPLSGHRTGGWGIGPMLSNFTQAWYCQVLHRYNEAIAMDYVIPFRVITPAPGKSANPEASDPILNLNLGNYAQRIQTMIKRRKRHPTDWNTLPFPIEYQMLGGEAKDLAPFELIDQGISLLLNNIGVPAELYKGTLQLQTATPALRLFESWWTHLCHGLNSFLRNLCTQVSEAMSWEPVKAKLTSPTIIDDLQEQMAKMQLMMQKAISQTTGLKALGIDFKDEQRRLLDEERFTQEQSAKLQEEMGQASAMEQMGAPQQGAPPGDPSQAQQGGDPSAQQQQPPGGGQGPAGVAAQNVAAQTPTSPNSKVTPQELLSKAQTISQDMMVMSETQRSSELSKLKSADPTLHAIVRQTIDDIRQSAQTAGGAQLLSQQFGQK